MQKITAPTPRKLAIAIATGLSVVIVVGTVIFGLLAYYLLTVSSYVARQDEVRALICKQGEFSEYSCDEIFDTPSLLSTILGERVFYTNNFGEESLTLHRNLASNWITITFFHKNDVWIVQDFSKN